MTANPRRPAFRLPWTGEADESSEPQPDVTATSDASQPGEANGSLRPQPAGEGPGAEVQPGAEPSAPGDSVASAASDAVGSTEFMRSLMTAMRSVAESSRDSSLAELRQSVESRIEELKASASTQADELRRLADQDITAVEEWEKAEQERVRSEAERRREERRAQLGRQLAEHQAASQREIEETRRRLAEHERELAAFFAQLGDISDPAAFVAAAKRIPQAPELSPALPANLTTEPATNETDPPPAEPGAAAVDEPEWPEPTPRAGADTRLAERLAELDARLAEGPDSTEDVSTTTPPSPIAANGNGEASTAIVVKGLGSFGAITSFKQALERIEGIRGVTLSLGPTGEFVYRASHAAQFDVAGAIRSIEGPSATIDESEGSLLVTVNRGR